MLRQDYVLREIERLVQFCLKAAGIQLSGEARDLRQFLEDHSETVTGLRLETVLESPPERLVALLYHPGTAKIPQLVACGAWLCEAARLRLLEEAPAEARALFLRGAQILAFLTAQHGASDEFTPLGPHLAELRERVADLDYPAPERERIEALLSTPPGGG